MVQETFKGTTCPKCASFIKTGISKCEVCGFDPGGEEKEEIEKKQAVSREKIRVYPVICPRCGTGNQADFKFCKICKHPLDKTNVLEKEAQIIPEETKDKVLTSLSKVSVEFHWLEPHGGKVESKLELNDFQPFFNGYAGWDNYAFFIYQNSYLYEVLVRKIDLTGQSMLYRISKSIELLRDRSIFCLGQLAFQLMENFRPSNETVVIGPGAVPHHSTEGKKGLRIMNKTAEKEFIEIKETCRINRDWISRQFGLDKERLRMNGVSREHIRIIPLADGRWQLEAMNAKNIFVLIDEVPVPVKEGETLRWVMGNQYGEFKLKINDIEV
jgi:hypothetical protein